MSAYRSIGLALMMLTASVGAQVTTPELMTRSLQGAAHKPFGNCLNYRVVGACFWLDCPYGICSVKTSAKVKHHLPDVVVNSYADHEAHPWKHDPRFLAEHAMRRKLGERLLQRGQAAPVGKGQPQGVPAQESAVMLMETTVTGNPGLLALRRMSGFFLQGQASPYQFYFHSGASAAVWRDERFEILNPQIFPKLLPGRFEVGQGLDWSWGAVFPRAGFIAQSQSAKAAAVAAVRGTNVATTANGFYFLATNLTQAPCRDTRCRSSGESLESNADTLWQRVYPAGENQCSAAITQGQSEPSWAAEGLQNEHSNQGYTWLLWRTYKGCLPSSGKFLTDVEWG